MPPICRKGAVVIIVDVHDTNKFRRRAPVQESVHIDPNTEGPEHAYRELYF